MILSEIWESPCIATSLLIGGHFSIGWANQPTIGWVRPVLGEPPFRTVSSDSSKSRSGAALSGRVPLSLLDLSLLAREFRISGLHPGWCLSLSPGALLGSPFGLRIAALQGIGLSNNQSIEDSSDRRLVNNSGANKAHQSNGKLAIMTSKSSICSCLESRTLSTNKDQILRSWSIGNSFALLKIPCKTGP